jgi:hypothetical protein
LAGLEVHIASRRAVGAMKAKGLSWYIHRHLQHQVDHYQWLDCKENANTSLNHSSTMKTCIPNPNPKHRRIQHHLHHPCTNAPHRPHVLPARAHTIHVHHHNQPKIPLQSHNWKNTL